MDAIEMVPGEDGVVPEQDITLYGMPPSYVKANHFPAVFLEGLSNTTCPRKKFEKSHFYLETFLEECDSDRHRE